MEKWHRISPQQKAWSKSKDCRGRQELLDISEVLRRQLGKPVWSWGKHEAGGALTHKVYEAFWAMNWMRSPRQWVEERNRDPRIEPGAHQRLRSQGGRDASPRHRGKDRGMERQHALPRVPTQMTRLLPGPCHMLVLLLSMLQRQSSVKRALSSILILKFWLIFSFSWASKEVGKENRCFVTLLESKPGVLLGKRDSLHYIKGLQKFFFMLGDVWVHILGWIMFFPLE